MATYHFIGIKGTGMSALAHILFDAGNIVQGSDVAQHFFTQDALEKKGILILPFDENNIKAGQIVIAGNAFNDDNIEIKRAKKLGLKFYKYHEFLGELVDEYTSVAVTGSHGKTSTTGLLAHVLEKNVATSYLIGDGTGKGHEANEYFAFEACEYKRHFLHYRPDYAIITNIDFDHPDYFTDVADVFNAFQTLANQVKKAIIACGDDKYLPELKANVPIVYYGFNEINEFQARNVKELTDGTKFDVFIHDQYYDTVHIPLYGNHQILNALSVIAFCYYEKLPQEVIHDLDSFQGVKRRFSEKIVANQIIIDDYAHHPIEINATIESARKKYPGKRIVAIFQPHTFSRTEAFLAEFATSLNQADEVFLCDIFSSARELQGDLTIDDLLSKVINGKVLTVDNVHELSELENSVYLFMGAGDIQKYQAAFEATLAK